MKFLSLPVFHRTHAIVVSSDHNHSACHKATCI